MATRIRPERVSAEGRVSPGERDAADVLRGAAFPVTGAAGDFDPLLDLIGNARFVLLGEASHGTHEFYRARAEITRRLIEEKGFAAVVVEADWPDAYRVNRYVQGFGTTAAPGDAGQDQSANEALADFQRFPSWMWRNADVLDFVGWLRAHNEGRAPGSGKVSFYGMDLYSLFASLEAVITYLAKVDPEGAARARQRYACFEAFEKDVQAYGFAAGIGAAERCEDEVVAQLVELLSRGAEYAGRGGPGAEDEHFFATQNARLAKNAEAYYRAMFRSGVASWNLRDRHMAETIDALVTHLEARWAGPVRLAVWAHNSHLGDARATAMGQRGECNVGQLVRERYGREAVLVGFSTYTGTVTAASDWDAPAERWQVRPGLPGSYESLFHEVGMPAFFLPLRGHGSEDTAAALREPRLERAIGVVYRPETERQSHYFHASLPSQFDAMLHFDRTRGVEPLERTPAWPAGAAAEEVPETFPTAV
ncbi:MAG TPA: erythromycin esterase family protein [Chloroflexota bacterium]|nr:erythromycin esterase family protein [Chloroflexota bacterium]